jgi:hypothetical protein
VLGSFRWDTRESNDFLPYSHHPYAYALGNPINWTDPTGTCVAEESGPQGCDPSFEQQLRAFITRTALNEPYYRALVLDKGRGNDPLTLFFDQHWEEALHYYPTGDLAWVDLALSTWVLDYYTRRGEAGAAVIQRHKQAMVQAAQEGAAFLVQCELVAATATRLAQIGVRGSQTVLGFAKKLGGAGTGYTKADRQALKDWENEGGSASPYTKWTERTTRHDVGATAIFGKGKGRRFGQDRAYDKFYKGVDIEYKADNFSKPRTATELTRIHNQADTDIMLKNAGRSNPHWHFENDPRVAPDMRSLLDKLTNNGISWTYGSKAPF